MEFWHFEKSDIKSFYEQRKPSGIKLGTLEVLKDRRSSRWPKLYCSCKEKKNHTVCDARETMKKRTYFKENQQHDQYILQNRVTIRWKARNPR